MGLALGLKMSVLRGLMERGALYLWGPGDQGPCRPRAFTAGGPVECLRETQDISGPCPRDPIPRGPSLGPSTFWSTLETWCLSVTCSGALASSETCLPIPVHLRVRASLKPLTCNKPCLMPVPGSHPPGEGLSQGPVFPVDPGSLLSLVAPPSVPALPGSSPVLGSDPPQ